MCAKDSKNGPTRPLLVNFLFFSNYIFKEKIVNFSGILTRIVRVE